MGLCGGDCDGCDITRLKRAIEADDGVRHSLEDVRSELLDDDPGQEETPAYEWLGRFGMSGIE